MIPKEQILIMNHDNKFILFTMFLITNILLTNKTKRKQIKLKHVQKTAVQQKVIHFLLPGTCEHL